MTRAMKTILLLAIMVLTIIPFSAYAHTIPDPPDDITDIVSGTVVEDPFNNNIDVEVTVNGGLNTGNVFGGYGVLGDMELLVVTSHPGVKDSETQSGPPGATFYICQPNDEINNPNWCEPVWHTHLVELQEDTTNTCEPNTNLGGARLEVKRLTFEEPSTSTNIADPTIQMEDVPTDPVTLTNSITGLSETFDLGDLADPKQLVQFNLVGRFAGSVLHVCVEDVETKTAGFFVLPESAIGAIAIVGASVAALGAYMYRKRTI